MQGYLRHSEAPRPPEAAFPIEPGQLKGRPPIHPVEAPSRLSRKHAAAVSPGDGIEQGGVVAPDVALFAPKGLFMTSLATGPAMLSPDARSAIEEHEGDGPEQHQS